MEPEGTDRTTLTDREVRAILEEAAAAELAHSVTVEELRLIAAEAGYSPEAVNLAIEHIISARDVSATPTESHEPRSETKNVTLQPSWVRLVCMLGGGALIGEVARVASQYQSGDSASIFALAIIAVSSLLIGMEHRHHGTQAGYQIDVASLWLGFFGGWTAINSGFNGEVLVLTSMLWAATALAGGLIASAYLSFRNSTD